MKSFLRSLEALYPSGLGAHPDIALAAGVAAILCTLVVPLPVAVLDILLAMNIAASALILVSVLLASRPLALSSLPTILLLSTLFRLALNVSTTRMILAHATAGEVVQAFGMFVVRGDLLVGIVVFVVITLVQFLVIAKGAERVAEVGARFTLDAMPGKQMSIDADLRAGAITDEQAAKRRVELGRESQFYGAMDGAMKFVKGDAIAGLIITAVNLIAGLTLGSLRHGMSLVESSEVYAILSIGDGLVSQVPALFVTLSAGVLITRVADPDKRSDLGRTLQSELLSRPKAVGIAAVFAAAIGTVPGLPAIPFLTIAAIFASIAYVLHRRASLGMRTRTAGPGVHGSESFDDQLRKKVAQAKAQKANSDQLAPTVALLGVELGGSITAELGFIEGNDDDTELIVRFIPQLRDAIYLDTGVRVPGVRVRTNVAALAPNGFAVTIKEVPVIEGTIDLERSMVMDTVERVARLGIDAISAVHPMHDTPVALIESTYAEEVTHAGSIVWPPAGILALHIAKGVRDHITAFIGFQEVSDLVKRLEKAYPELVKEVTPKLVSIPQLTDILRRLADEMVSIRDLKTILETLGEHAPYENDAVALTELVRASLALQIAHAHGGIATKLGVLLLDPEIEDILRDGIMHKNNTRYLALEPDLQRAIMDAVFIGVRPIAEAGARPIILASPDIRRYLRKLLESKLSLVSVLSHQELPPELTVQPLGFIRLDELSAGA